MTMPTNYEKLIANKKGTVENVNTYVSGVAVSRLMLKRVIMS